MTWSIVARDADTGAFGVAVTTKFFAVGALCPHAISGIGALSTQALVNPIFGPRGLRLLIEVEQVRENRRLAAGIGAGLTIALDHHGTAPSASISSNDIPGPHNNAAGSGSSLAPLNRAAVAKRVDPGLVDITSTLKYNSETAEGTGMIISSSGLVLTNNHVIDGATVVRATLAADHRVSDGHDGARFLTAIDHLLHNPEAL